MTLSSGFEAPSLWEPVLAYWFGDGLEAGWPTGSRNQLWFNGGRELDDDIRHRFGSLVEAALWSELVDWEARPRSRLALVLLLDQFTRHIYRGTAAAFAGDHRALTLVNEGIARDMDVRLPWVGRVFFYMPLMHAEDLSAQDECVRRLECLVAEAPAQIANRVQDNLEHARQHREVIVQFGRFPHRNVVLGRDSSAEELDYLRTARRFGQ